MDSIQQHQDRCRQDVHASSARNEQWLNNLDARRSAERQQQADQQAQTKNREHARQMQKDKFEQERKIRQMELAAQWRGGGR